MASDQVRFVEFRKWSTLAALKKPREGKALARKIRSLIYFAHVMTNLIVARNFNAYCISCFALGGNLHANFIFSFQAAGKRPSWGTFTKLALTKRKTV